MKDEAWLPSDSYRNNFGRWEESVPKPKIFSRDTCRHNSKHLRMQSLYTSQVYHLDSLKWCVNRHLNRRMSSWIPFNLYHRSVIEKVLTFFRYPFPTDASEEWTCAQRSDQIDCSDAQDGCRFSKSPSERQALLEDRKRGMFEKARQRFLAKEGCEDWAAERCLAGSSSCAGLPTDSIHSPSIWYQWPRKECDACSFCFVSHSSSFAFGARWSFSAALSSLLGFRLWPCSVRSLI